MSSLSSSSSFTRLIVHHRPQWTSWQHNEVYTEWDMLKCSLIKQFLYVWLCIGWMSRAQNAHVHIYIYEFVCVLCNFDNNLTALMPNVVVAHRWTTEWEKAWEREIKITRCSAHITKGYVHFHAIDHRRITREHTHVSLVHAWNAPFWPYLLSNAIIASSLANESGSCVYFRFVDNLIYLLHRS